MECSSKLALVAAALLFTTSTAHADDVAPSLRKPRGRTCCALATHLPLHLGSAHVPITLGQLMSTEGLGHHSYTGWERLSEGNGLLYTVRGGYIDLGHTRDFADMTAYLAVHLRSLLAQGKGSIELDPLLAKRRVVVTRAVPREHIAETSLLLARRMTFDVSVWTEIGQFYGRGKMRGAEEKYSAFTPEDLYSNLLGTWLGANAVASPRPYDDALTEGLRTKLFELGAVSTKTAERTTYALAGTWWSADTAWPSPEIAILRSFELGPHLLPVIAPPDVQPPMPRGGDASPVAQDVPVDGPTGKLADIAHVELEPDPETLPFFAQRPLLTSADLPAIVAAAHVTDDARKEASRAAGPAPANEASPLTHFENGIRLLELEGMGGVFADPAEHGAKGIGGGSLTAIVGDTRGGDFHFASFGVGNTDERGIVSSFALFRADAVYFCHDPETSKLRAPFVSLLGPCSPGEILGIGGNVGEAFHDGRTGRTALRPVALHGVLNVLGNGQSASYDRVRFLLRGGGAVEHVWSTRENGLTIPRVGGKAVVMARSPGGRIEARGMTEYRIDPSTPDDAALESSATLRFYFLLGGKETRSRGGEPRPVDGIDPWGIGSVGVTSGFSWWSRPLHAFPDPSIPFVSTERKESFQLLLTATLGFEGLSF